MAVSILCCVLTFLPVIIESISGMCSTSCSCRDTGNNSTFCLFDKNVEKNIQIGDLFDSPIEYIRNLRLELNSKGNIYLLKFPFKVFFQLGFPLLRDLFIISDKQLLSDDALFRIDDLEVLPKLSSITLRIGVNVLAPINMSVMLNLRYLNVSSTTHLFFDDLCDICKVSGTTLEEVYADGINYNIFKGEFITTTLDDTFFSCFNKSSLRVLHISGSNIHQISSPNLHLYVPSIEVIDVSNTDASFDMHTYKGILKLDKLRKLNIPDSPLFKMKEKQNCEITKYRQTRCDNLFCKQFNSSSVRLFHALEILNMGRINDCHKRSTFGCEHQSQCVFPKHTVLRELYLAHICIIRMDMHISGLNRLEKFDFSMNHCEYISSLAFTEMSSLTTLLLNGNSLSTMEKTDPDELRILFRNNSKLRLLNLSSNGFTRLHSDMFETNKQLEHLDLSENFLHNTDWLSSTLEHLRSLDLKGNRLMTIDARTRHVVDNLGYGYNFSLGGVDGIQINLANNPISCGCDQEDMLNWLSRRKRYISDIYGIVCAKAGGSLAIYTEDIQSYINSCNFQRYKGLLALCTIPVILAIFVVLYVRYYRHILRIRRIRKHFHEFIQDNFQIHRRFLLYLAYSFSDSDIVLNRLFPELEGRLQKEVGEKENLVCISDRDFDVGVSISDEIIHAITSSSAVLFIISKEFARSRWCEFEAEVAMFEHKPIILVTVENVKVRSLPSSLRKVCFKWTRLEWPGVENQDKVEEFWQKLVKAIIKYKDDIKTTPL